MLNQCSNCRSFAVNEDPDKKLCDICYYKTQLLNLLAVVHRDGGHYTDEHGIRKSAKDALKIIYNVLITGAQEAHDMAGIEVEGQVDEIHADAREATARQTFKAMTNTERPDIAIAILLHAIDDWYEKGVAHGERA